jgi:lipopolysaccharide/colanic/teichoic acid biosynthesis glycosyltransferase
VVEIENCGILVNCREIAVKSEMPIYKQTIEMVKAIPQKPYSSSAYIIERIVNSLLAFFLLLYSFPLLLIIIVLIKLEGIGPVFYRGVRLGKDKKRFTIFKFRTLDPDAQRILGAELHNSKHKLATTYGLFLRYSRLDELPQLCNILKGDMNFIGPRPVRPEVYRTHCMNIVDYDKRFAVKPGLVGYSQLFTPHGSPKRIRAIIDNRIIAKKKNVLSGILIIVITALSVVKITLHQIFILMKRMLNHRIMKRYREKRAFERQILRDAKVYIGEMLSENDLQKSNRRLVKTVYRNDRVLERAKLVNINEEAILILSDVNLKKDIFIFKFERELKSRFSQRVKVKSALCMGQIYRKCETVNPSYKYSYVIKYTPVSPLNYYMLYQYFLKQSIITPAA